MGLKKYEIITVGSDKRVRALRSWRVQDRYVNIGDVGGIVYDEKTLSQDGACWLFRGNFGFPGARIGGDSIVDVGEAALSATGASSVDILGSSTVVGAPVRFSSVQTEADAVVLTAGYFEQGTFSYRAGTNWESWKAGSPNYLRTKAPIFMGGAAVTLKLDVPGYIVQAFVLDRDGIGTISTSVTNTGEGITLTVPTGQYFTLRLAKSPVSAIVPADATAAQIKFTGTYETKLVMIDSRLELNPATITGTIMIRPGGAHAISPGAKYPDSVIQSSKVTINSHETTERKIDMLTELVNVNATIYATMADAQAAGIYHGINNLAFTGNATSNQTESARPLIQAYNCDNMVVNPTNFPGLAAMLTAGVPIKFYNCNLNNGRFYHHAQIANTYRDINFDLATKDLGKQITNPNILVSSEVNGMYRLYSIDGSVFGALIESYESVKSLTLSGVAESYGTAIYADAYLNGLFDFKGTNVFGNAVKHEASNAQNVMAAQGIFNATSAGGNITGIVSNATRVCVPEPFRINGPKGLTISNLPAGFEAAVFMTDANGVITRDQSSTMANTDLAANSLVDCKAYIQFKKVSGDPTTPDEVKGVTVTVYNGCKIVNTKATCAVIAGNVRVEDNAMLIDTSVTGTGYFGGNSIAQGLVAEGLVYMKDNAVFAPTITGTPKASILRMTDNASFTGGWSGAGTRLTMSDNARYRSTTALNTLGVVGMRGNADISGSGSVSVSGVLVLKDDARIDVGDVSVSGDITLGGKYTQTASKVWTGKRVIASQDAPLYDDNVKTQYDF